VILAVHEHREQRQRHGAAPVGPRATTAARIDGEAGAPAVVAASSILYAQTKRPAR
jgi:hypothetical protein